MPDKEMAKPQYDKKRVDELVAKKLELSAKIRDLRAEAAKINMDLARAGADHTMIASW